MMRNLRRVNMGNPSGTLRWFTWKVDPHLVFGPYVWIDDRETGKIVGAACLFDDGVGVLEDLVNSHGVHLAAVIVAGLDGVLEVAASGLGSKVVGDDVAGAAFLLDPGQVWHGDSHGAALSGQTGHWGGAEGGGVGRGRGGLFCGPRAGLGWATPRGGRWTERRIWVDPLATPGLG